jgi:hypothetical protein
MCVTPNGEFTARNISEWHKVIEIWRVGIGRKGRKILRIAYV